MMPTYAKEQPLAGDHVAHCGHLAGAAHWFKYEPALTIRRPHGETWTATWLVLCERCYVQHGTSVRVHGVASWTGSAPVIMEEEKN